MRLMLVHPWAGLPSRQALYARLQAATGWELLVVTTAKWRDDYGGVVEAVPAPELQGTLLPLPVGLSGNIPLHFFTSRLRPHVRRFRPDCVYIYHEPYAVATWQMLQAVKAVADVPVGVRSSQNIVKRYPPPFRQMEASVYRRSDFAVVVSDNVASVMHQKGYAKPIHVVPMPVDTAVFCPGEASDSPVLRVGYVGRLVPEKGVDIALRAVAGLTAGTATLTIVGSGPEEASLRELAATLGVTDRVEWRGALNRDATAAIYRQMDVVVVPSRATASWTEQYGRVVVEAGASGVPAVVTRSGELPFLVAKVGAGWVVEEDDAAGMTAVLARLGADRPELRQAGAAALRTVTNTLSDEVIADQLAQTFRGSVDG